MDLARLFLDRFFQVLGNATRPQHLAPIDRIANLAMSLNTTSISVLFLGGSDNEVAAVCSEFRRSRYEPTIALLPVTDGSAINFKMQPWDVILCHDSLW